MLTTIAQVGLAGTHMAVVTAWKNNDLEGFSTTYPKIALGLAAIIIGLGAIEILRGK